MSIQIDVTKTKNPGELPAWDTLGFGKYFADHMFTLEYSDGGWKNPQIKPYAPFTIAPGASALHYGQALFEGMKAFRGVDNKLRLFRTSFHAERMQAGAKRLCMPGVPTEMFNAAVEAIVRTDHRWVPKERGCALYLRPTLIGTESFLGVRPSEKYLFFIISSPVGTYYSEGFNAVKIWVETNFVRAAPGGLGATKAAANYAASLYAAVEAKKQGYAQVLWLDSKEHRYIEEVGTMNVFFKIGDEVITPPLDGTILGGGTRDCVLQILRKWGNKVSERRLSIDELQKASSEGRLEEAFGTGTAAVITPVSEFASPTMKIKVGNGKTGALTQKLYEEISGLQYGERADTWGWSQVLSDL